MLKTGKDCVLHKFCKSYETLRFGTVCNQIRSVEKRRFLDFHSNKKYFPFNRGRNCGHATLTDD